MVVFSSAHPSIFNWGEWTRRCRRLPDSEYNSQLASASEKVVQEFLKLLTGFLHRTLSSQDLTPQEKQQWVQSGLALSPLVATCTQYLVDFCLAWALIGEWTSRILFPVLKGPWPRHGHAGALLRRYQARSPRMVAWARATFEQGALPSLLFLQGLVPIFTLPGDKMFQAMGLCSHKQRPPMKLKVVWHKHCNPLQARAGSHLLLPWLERANDLDYGYLMLPPGVLHISALGRFGRFTPFSPRVSHSNTCRLLSFVCLVFFLFVCFVALLCFCFLFCKCLGIPNSPLFFVFLLHSRASDQALSVIEV